MIKEHYNMNFYPNKIHVEILKEGLYGGTYFKNIYSDATNKWSSDFWKDFRDIIDGNDPKYFNSRFYDTPINKYVVACSCPIVQPS